MTKAEEHFNELLKQVPDVKPGKMFGSKCIKTPNGKSAAMLWKDMLVVKLNGESLKQALNLEGAQLFEPMKGKLMKEWVQIPFSHQDKWKKFALISADLVRIL